MCSTTKTDLVRSLGADHVIDYTRDDLATGGQRYDVILGIGGNAALSRLRRVLAPKGTLVIVGGETSGRWLAGTDRQLRAGPVVRLRRNVVDDTRIWRLRMATFRAVVRYFRPEQASGLAVIDIPAEIAAGLGGLRQMKVHGSLNDVEFASNVMPAGGGVLALSVNKKLLAAAGVTVGDEATVEIERTPPN